MATAKQIAANRANAKRSTGPRTFDGKKRSSLNAIRHGLSSKVRDDDLAARARRLAKALACRTGIDTLLYLDFAWAQLQADRVRRVQAELNDRDGALTDIGTLRELIATDRYDRRAQTKAATRVSPMSY